MKTQLPSKSPWKSSREPLRVREPQVENHWSMWSSNGTFTAVMPVRKIVA